MGRKGVISVFILLAGLLLSEHGAKGQTSAPAAGTTTPTTKAPDTTTTQVTTTIPETTTQVTTTTPETTTQIPTTTSETTTQLPTTTPETTKTQEPQTTLLFESTTTLGVVISNNACPSYALARDSLCSSVTGSSDINSFLASGDLSTVCTHSMLQYGCASLGDLPASTITAILNCSLANSLAVTSQESFSLITTQLSIDKLGVVINSINNMVPFSLVTEDNLLYLLNAVWETICKSEENFNPGFFATWFQEKLYSFLPAINLDILNSITGLPLTCDDFEAIVSALDVSYSKFDQDKKEQIGSWITRFIQAHTCKKSTPAESIKAYYKSFVSNVNVNDFSVAWGSTDLGSATDAFTDFQLAQYVSISNTFNSYESASTVLKQLETQDFTYIFNFLSTLTVSNYDQDIMYSLLRDILIKVNSSDDPLCKPKLNTIFQGKLSYLFRAVNSSILDLIVPTDCSEFQDIYKAIDEVFDDLSEDIQQLVFDYRLNFLNAEALKSAGSSCTYGLSSTQWLQLNFGKSIKFLSYAIMIQLNSNFDGFDAITLLNQNQTLDLLIQSNIFTSPSPNNYEIHIEALISILKTKGYVYLQGFLMNLRITLIQFNIKFISNANVRYQFLQGVWEILQTQFAQFSVNDWYTWYTEYLYFFLPSITSKQLSVLSNTVVEDCSNLQTIVGGFDSGFEYMNQETKSDVANWIVGFLKNDTSKCLGDDWLNVNFKHFKSLVSIVEIKQLNPDFSLIDSLTELTAVQIGQAVVTETAALSNVTYIEMVFDVLTNSSTPVENLGSFWDSFTTDYEQVEQFTEEVKYKMLELTTDELAVQYDTFTAQDYYTWFEKRLYPVTVVIDSVILGEIPLTIDCDSYKSVVHALSINYDETVPASKGDVFDFITNFLTNGTKCADTEVSTLSYLTTSFGSYSAEATYEELKLYYKEFNAFDTGVLEIFTDTQFGDFMVVEEVYQSEDNAIKVFDYLKTLPVEKVDTRMAQFTSTAIKRNINITDITVGGYMLQSYLTILRTSLSKYTNAQIMQLFQIRISILIKFFTVQTLELFVIENCDTLVVIVNQLDKGFSGMSEQTKTSIAYWILGLLKNTKFNGCASISQTTSEWVESTFKSFFAYVTLKEVQEVYPSLDIITVIANTSITQKVEYIISGQVLQNTEETMTVLESLSGSNNDVSVDVLYTFMDSFNAAYGSLNVKNMSIEVQQEAMTYLFTIFLSNLNSLTTVQISQFKTKFQYFLSGISIDAVKKIPMTISCDVFEAIFSAFSSVLNKISKEVARFIFEVILNYLQTNYTASTDVCATLYTNSKTYVQNIFFGFLKYATFYEIDLYYSQFNVYEVLTELTGQQLGNLFINSTALTDQFEAVQILVELGKREYTNVLDFMSELTTVAQEKNIVALPDANIESLIYKTVWSPIVKNLRSSEDFSLWFNGSLKYIISSVSTSDIENIPVNNDCTSQSYVVQGFGKVFDKLKDDQKKTMYDKIKGFNTDIKNTKGSACETTSGSSSEWVKTYYGAFIEYATLKELTDANSNFNAADSLSVISGSQVADYAIESKALWKEKTTVAIFESMDNIKKVEDFFVHLNDVAPDQLSTSPVVDLIISETFNKISTEFSSFTQDNWTIWTQEILTNILFAINVTELELIPFPLPCASYQNVVQGFSKVFDQMKEKTKQIVYDNCIKRQLSSTPVQSGVRCGQQTQKSQEWVDVNFGKFYKYANITEFEEWNINFKSTEVIETLNPDQLAEVAVESIEKEEVACQVAGRVQQFTVEDAYSFLDTFYASLQKTSKTKITNKEIGSKFLSSAITAIQSAFSGYSLSDWENLFSVKIQPFLYSINAGQLTTILASADCNGYVTAVKYLSSEFDDLSADIQLSLYTTLSGFLQSHQSPSGVCPVSGEDSSASISRLYGKFIVFANYTDLTTNIIDFNGPSTINLLSPEQVASLAFSGNLLTDATQAQVLVDRVKSMSFSQLDIFLSSFQAIGEQKNIGSLANAEVQGLLFIAVFETVSGQFSSFSNEQWSNYWTYKFNLFLSSITESQIQLIPLNINCNAFQSVISGCSSHYNALTEAVQSAIFQKAKSYLTTNTPASGPKCPASSGGSGAWIDDNLGLFSEFATIDDIKAMYSGFSFTDAVSFLTADQLGYYVANADVLSDKDKISKVMAGITSETIGEFMDSFNDGVTKAGIKQITNLLVKKFFLGEIFCKLGSLFSSFKTNDFSTWFQTRLPFFISAIDAKSLGFISTDISCDSLAAIMEPLSKATNPEHPNDIYSFVLSVLQAQQTSSGVACTSADLDSRSWLVTYFGQYSTSGTWNDFATLYPGFKVSEVLDLLTEVQLASASASSTVIQSSSEISNVLLSFSGSIDSFLIYMGTLQDYFLKNPSLLSNTKVRDALLMSVANYVFPSFGSFDLQTTEKWMNTISYLLPGVNGTMLDEIPSDTGCEQYQAILNAFNGVFNSLSTSKKQDIAAFQKRYLTYQVANGDGCITGSNGLISYIQKNIGDFCKQFTPEEVKQLNPDIDEVSFTQYCNLS